MSEKTNEFLKNRLSEEDYRKLLAIDKPEMHEFVADYIELCNPDGIFVATDSPDDIRYVREAAIRNGEEDRLTIREHTIHFDGYYDQARDKARTKFLVRSGVDLGPNLNTIDKEKGEREIREILKDIMSGHELYVRFFCLGPVNSEFSIPCVQLTDSAYVAHSEDLLYRRGYEEFKHRGRSARFFKFVHSAGELDERMVSKNIDKRRIYIDCEGAIVYSVNTQYGGNTIGLKKPAMRLAIHRAQKEGWLNEHMLVVAVHGPNNRKTFFTGAFPSLCGKTSTAMIPEESIVGDDISYIRKRGDKAYAVNVEAGIFGIIMGINSKDDPITWEALHSPNEIIFSNVLVTEDKGVYWIGKDGKMPRKGINHSGEWTPGKRDAEGNEITPSHKNARFTTALKDLKNADPRLHDPDGVELSGVIYGGRDSDTCVPVLEAFDWTHGIITKGASLESETTAATLGKEGVRKFNPMSNLDFLSVPIGKYIDMNLKFGSSMKKPPRIFGVNYFLKDEGGNFTNEKTDKKVWLKWMELRVHDEVGAIKTPTGYIPRYEDLKKLFREVLNKDYSRDDYVKQFTIRVPENLAKIDRIKKIYETTVANTPPVLFEVLKGERERLVKAREKYGDYITPDRWEGER
ncbi:phosphoenolpyruvate carboxykinase (GTP) [candidate division WOR-3 bacterium JGI_Cruoil_03_44_89]|uniref:Phosphoenolpyruvate carboxykinase [GTP] n=1 Tax=candidate division WOR-3 bacterium JGI_Cruoil_03_44_89 TaxID=1973748 RepID=A0A235BY90_UNCW3|nr:MAG: phosphoenolpyruvate carboxykinase (GTP) [candidate division WOR-3 bacterium JGI_Cruoil_03_44_89]